MIRLLMISEGAGYLSACFGPEDNQAVVNKFCKGLGFSKSNEITGIEPLCVNFTRRNVTTLSLSEDTQYSNLSDYKVWKSNKNKFDVFKLNRIKKAERVYIYTLGAKIEEVALFASAYSFYEEEHLYKSWLRLLNTDEGFIRERASATGYSARDSAPVIVSIGEELVQIDNLDNVPLIEGISSILDGQVHLNVYINRCRHCGVPCVDIYCNTCMENLSQCDHCDEIVPSDSLRELGGEQICRDCYEEEIYDSQVVSYHAEYSSYVPINGSKFNIGMELEYSQNCGNRLEAGETALAIRNHMNSFLYSIQEDSSLQGCGLEFITQPVDIEKMEQFDWETFCDILRSNGYNTNGAGIHIHISKHAFSDYSSAKAKFAYILLKYYEELKQWGRRTYTDYCSPLDGSLYNNSSRLVSIIDNANHSDCVNVRSHGLEYRLIASSLEPYEILEAIQGVHSIVDCINSNRMETLRTMPFDSIITFGRR